jgi:TRAP-type C4-dicarboxylate transport system permease small subunit
VAAQHARGAWRSTGVNVLRFVSREDCLRAIAGSLRVLYGVLERISRWLDRLSVGAGVLMLVIMLALTFVGVILRYGFSISYSWQEHFIVLMLAWSIFIVVGSSTRSNDHIMIGFLIEKMAGSEERAARIRTALDNVIGLGITIFVTWALYRWTSFSRSLGSDVYVQDVGYYPEWIRRVPVVAGMGLVSFFYVERIVRQLVHLTSPRSEEDPDQDDTGSGGERPTDSGASNLPPEDNTGDGRET